MPRDKRVRLIVDGRDEASDEINKVNQSLRELNRTARASFKAIGAFVAGRMMLDFGRQLARFVADAAMVDNVRVAFNALARDMGRDANKLLADLRRLSGGMIADRDIMMSFNKAAQLVGRDFAARLGEALPLLQKYSAATGENMNFLLNSLVTGVGRLSPMILDNLGIQVKLSEATALAAQMFGKEANQLSKAEIQAAMFDLVLSRLAENTAGMPDITDSASAGFARFGAEIQNVKDRIGAALAPALDSLAGAMLPIVQVLGPQLADTAASIANALATLAPYLQDAYVLFASVAAVIGEYVAQLTSVLDNMGIMFQWRDVLMAVGVAIATVILPTLGSLIASILPVIATIIGLAFVVGMLRKEFQTNFSGIRAATQAFSKFMTTAFTLLGTWLVNLQVKVTTFLSQIWHRFTAWFQETIWTRFTSVLAFIGDVFRRLVEIFGRGWQGLKNITGRALHTIANVVGDAMSGVAESIASLFERIPRIGPAIAARIRGAAGAIRGAASRAAAVATGALGNTLGGAIQSAVDKINAMLSRLPQMASGLKNTFTDKLIDIANDARKAFDLMRRGVDAGIKKAAEAFNRLKDTGKGLWKRMGLDEFIKRVEAKMAEMREAIQEKAKPVEITPPSVKKVDVPAITEPVKKAKEKIRKTFADIMADARKALEFIDWKLRQGLIKPVEAIQDKIRVWQRVMEEAFKRGLINQANDAAKEIKKLLKQLDELTGRTTVGVAVHGLGLPVPRQAIAQRSVTYNIWMTTSQPTQDVIRDLRIIETMAV